MITKTFGFSHHYHIFNVYTPEGAETISFQTFQDYNSIIYRNGVPTKKRLKDYNTVDFAYMFEDIVGKKVLRYVQIISPNVLKDALYTFWNMQNCVAINASWLAEKVYGKKQERLDHLAAEITAFYSELLEYTGTFAPWSDEIKPIMEMGLNDAKKVLNMMKKRKTPIEAQERLYYAIENVENWYNTLNMRVLEENHAGV